MTRATRDVDVLAGVTFPDPYRWLEDDGPEVQLWQDEQGAEAAAYVRDWPHFDRLRESVARFSTARFEPLPRAAGGRWFRTVVPEGRTQASVVVSDEPTGEGRVLYDPALENAARPPFVSWISPSPDGRILAVGVCADGSEQNTIRLVDVETGAALPGAPPQTPDGQLDRRRALAPRLQRLLLHRHRREGRRPGAAGVAAPARG